MTVDGVNGRAALQKASQAQKSMVDDVVKMLEPKK
jgi:hypothetical protein